MARVSAAQCGAADGIHKAISRIGCSVYAAAMDRVSAAQCDAADGIHLAAGSEYVARVNASRIQRHVGQVIP